MLGEAVNAAKDGAPQQDVDPGVQDLVPGGQTDPQLHQLAVVRDVGAQGAPPRPAHRHQAEHLQRDRVRGQVRGHVRSQGSRQNEGCVVGSN